MNRARIEALWLKHPTLTIVQVRRATGAPWVTVKYVHAQLVAAGKLQRPQRDFLRAV